MSENDTQAEHSQILSTGIENYDNLKDITTLVYLLQALFFIGFTPLIGVIINYFKRSDVRGSILESHFKWQIRTFWWGLIWYSISGFLIFTIIGAIIGYPMFGIVVVWWIYRFLRGWLRLNRGLPMYAS